MRFLKLKASEETHYGVYLNEIDYIGEIWIFADTTNNDVTIYLDKPEIGKSIRVIKTSQYNHLHVACTSIGPVNIATNITGVYTLTHLGQTSIFTGSIGNFVPPSQYSSLLSSHVWYMIHKHGESSSSSESMSSQSFSSQSRSSQSYSSDSLSSQSKSSFSESSESFSSESRSSGSSVSWSSQSRSSASHSSYSHSSASDRSNSFSSVSMSSASWSSRSMSSSSQSLSSQSFSSQSRSSGSSVSWSSQSLSSQSVSSLSNSSSLSLSSVTSGTSSEACAGYYYGTVLEYEDINCSGHIVETRQVLYYAVSCDVKNTYWAEGCFNRGDYHAPLSNPLASSGRLTDSWGPCPSWSPC